MERSVDHLVLATRNLHDLSDRYEALGFTLTPRASHNDEMGTSNRLVQLRDGTFIELLEVDRPGQIRSHDMTVTPPHFSFGAHNFELLKHREGLSMMVFKSCDVEADLKELAEAGMQTYDPFSFNRHAYQPDGSEREVAFRLGFVTHPDIPQVAFFFCENIYPENFWKPDFQRHANGAQALSAVYLCAHEPKKYRDFFSALVGSPGQAMEDGGLLFRLGGAGPLFVLTPEHCRAIAPDAVVEEDCGPVLSGFRVNRFGQTQNGRRVTPAGEAGGAFIPWGDVAESLPG